MKMTKASFEKIILNLQLAHKKSRELYKLGIDLMQYDESYEFVIDELFKATLNDEQRGWVDWFLYEKEGLRGNINKAWKKVGRKKVEICHTIDSLWETISEIKQTTFNDAKIQILENDLKKCARERDEYKHQLSAANKQIAAMKKKK